MNMRDLLIALFALVNLYFAKSPTKEPVAALKNPNLKKFFDPIPGLEGAVKGAFAGEFDFAELGAGLRAFTIAYGKDPNSRASIKSLLAAFSNWMRTGSEGALKSIEKNSASTVFPPWVATSFVKAVPKQGSLGKQLRSLMTQMTGKPTLDFELASERKAAYENYQDPEPNLAGRTRQYGSPIWATNDSLSGRD